MLPILLSLSLLGLTLAAPSSDETIERPFPFYFPDQTFEIYDVETKGFHATQHLNHNQIVEKGLEFLYDALGGINEHELSVQDSYEDRKGITHVYVNRMHQGVANHQAQVHLKKGQVTCYSTTFNASTPLKWRKHLGKKPISKETVIDIAVAKLKVPWYDRPIQEAIVENADGFSSHVFVLQLKDLREWLEVSIEVGTGKIIHVVDFSSKASYLVLPVTSISPQDGGFALLKNPENYEASPLGWQNDGKQIYNDTRGNNVLAYTIEKDIFNLENRVFVEKNPDIDSFISEWNGDKPPNSIENVKVSTTNLFFLVNFCHDLFYEYGFTEAAGNFQTNNFGKGGKENDAILAIAQDPSQHNNAYFRVSADGEPGEIHMFLFDFTNPLRDGAIDNSIPIHEMFHGVSNRLTGGPKNPTCLQAGEASAMGEGWSDAIAFTLQGKPEQNRTHTVFMGAYTLNNENGIRRFPYSTDMIKNPWTYSHLRRMGEVHMAGEVFAVMLYELYWNLVDDFGFSSNLFDSKQSEGNIVLIQLIIGGLMHQPCNPSFLDARDAIIHADKNYYNKKHTCHIWKAFAKRGLGLDATPFVYKNGYKVPDECASNSPK